MKSRGLAGMYRLLQRLDPASAQRLPATDAQRVLRMLEYRVRSGRPMSDAIADQPFGRERYRALKIGLRLNRSELRRCIETRVEEMVSRGLIEEVENLLSAGVSQDTQAFRAIGYREILKYLNKEVSLEEAKEEIKTATRQYAKRQVTWFRRENGIIWVDAVTPEAVKTEIIELIKKKGFGRR
jgi:tRNA dimethylallyltransferase